ncbi:hypothetical protein [Serratia sp. Se-RSBMAAmG]|uniref:hypothetical protein n=1 Tax=Serratia sp. Se-RSBMAAmG TaxID=3043305 RepID=UPI0024AF6410|nr:hypothetical protein [Serratia sp. Se-RSBMAAmG]MDI6977274.1 hypothetical protein [Serratia sp. Se-RSBMAAmG]
MRKALLLCLAFFLSACAQKAEIQTRDKLEAQSKSCFVDVLIKDGKKVIVSRVEKCSDHFVIELTDSQGGKFSFDYQGVKDFKSPDKVFMSLIMSHEKIKYQTFKGGYDIIEVPEISRRNMMQRFALMPEKTFSQDFENMNILIKIR